LDGILRCGRVVGGGVLGESDAEKERLMRLKWSIGFVLVVSSLAQKPTLRRRYDPKFFETTVVGSSRCGHGAVDEDDDPGGLVRHEVIRPIETLIYDRWLRTLLSEAKPPKSVKATSVIQFRVMADGSVESVKLVASSGNNVFDEAALRSVNTAKISPFSSDMTMRWVTLQLNFLVNMKCEDALPVTRN
jgi:TonB family protein